MKNILFTMILLIVIIGCNKQPNENKKQIKSNEIKTEKIIFSKKIDKYYFTITKKSDDELDGNLYELKISNNSINAKFNEYFFDTNITKIRKGLYSLDFYQGGNCWTCAGKYLIVIKSNFATNLFTYQDLEKMDNFLIFSEVSEYYPGEEIAWCHATQPSFEWIYIIDENNNLIINQVYTNYYKSIIENNLEKIKDIDYSVLQEVTNLNYLIETVAYCKHINMNFAELYSQYNKNEKFIFPGYNGEIIYKLNELQNKIGK